MNPQLGKSMPRCKDKQEGPNVGVVGFRKKALKTWSNTLHRLMTPRERIAHNTYLEDIFIVPSSKLLHFRYVRCKPPDGRLSKGWDLPKAIKWEKRKVLGEARSKR